MSAEHGHDSHASHSGNHGGGARFDFGISKMIAWFFGAASGAGATEMYKNGGGWGHGGGHH
jgi:hypothetical protein